MLVQIHEKFGFIWMTYECITRPYIQCSDIKVPTSPKYCIFQSIALRV